MRVDPKEEWRQIYHEIWRIERDFFYDPNAHGLNLKAAEEKYRPYAENVASRDDLNYLFSEMLGELSVGHLFVAGGAYPEVKHVAGEACLVPTTRLRTVDIASLGFTGVRTGTRT